MRTRNLIRATAKQTITILIQIQPQIKTTLIARVASVTSVTLKSN